MKVLNELVDQWFTEWMRQPANVIQAQYIAQRAADWAIAQREAELLAMGSECDMVDRYLRNNLGEEDYEQYSEELGGAIAAARLQGAEDERKKTDAALVAENRASLRITELEAQRDELLGALKEAEYYVVEALHELDDKYQRHPATEADRKMITDDMELIRAAIAKVGAA